MIKRDGYLPRHLAPTLILLAFVVGLFLLKDRADHYQPGPEMPDPLEIAMTGETGKPRPEFSLKDLTGTNREIREWDGRLLFINFWATWCPPCLREIPTFIELQDRYGDRGLQFLGVAIQEPAPVREFVKESGINYPVLVGQDDAMQAATEFGNRIGGLPFTAVVDRTGTIIYAQGGELSMEQAEKLIQISL